MKTLNVVLVGGKTNINKSRLKANIVDYDNVSLPIPDILTSHVKTECMNRVDQVDREEIILQQLRRNKNGRY